MSKDDTFTKSERTKRLLIIAVVTLVLVLVAFVGIYNSSWYQTRELDTFEKGQFYFNENYSAARYYDITKAQEYYRYAADENHPHAYYQLGRTLFIQGEFDEAIEMFEKQMQLHNEASPNVYYMLGLTYGFRARSYNLLHDWVRAEEYFLTYINEHEPYSPWPRVDLAWVYFVQGKFDEMGPIIESGLEYEPKNAWLLNMYGLYLLNSVDNPEQAIIYFQQAKESAETLTEGDWGIVYPGNNPEVWGDGLREFNDTIRLNINAAREALQ